MTGWGVSFGSGECVHLYNGADGDGARSGVGPGGGGTVVTVTGSGFTAGGTVKFGAAAATGVTFVSASSLTATAPPGAGAASVTVTAPGGVSVVTAGAVFTYANPVPTPSGKG